MAIDLTGGLPAEREYFFPARPENPEMRDSASFWITDDKGEIGLPRFGIEAVGSDWDAHIVTFNVVFNVTTTMVVPPWEQGALVADAAERLKITSDGDMMGHGPRIEQLCTAQGVVRVPGEEKTFTGSGLRIKRPGVRDLGDFRGHTWQSAVFPSGKAFGYITYPPHPDGRPVFNEGYLFLGEGKLIPAVVVEAPWLRRLVPSGDPVPVVFESELGITRIEGSTVNTTHDTVHRPEMPNFPVLFQGECRYSWDGEETYGMLERSTVRDLIEWA